MPDSTLTGVTISYDVCAICGKPPVWLLNGAPVCPRRHPGDPPDWTPNPLTLADRLAFYKERKLESSPDNS